MASEMIKKNIAFTPRMIEMADEIQEAKGYLSFSAVVQQALIDMHGKTFPSYLRTPAARETPEEKIGRKAQEKKAKEDLQRAEYVGMVAMLEGTIVEKGGKEFCKYYTYTHKKRFEQEVPLEMVSSDLVKTQYMPSREKVEQYQKEGKTEY